MNTNKFTLREEQNLYSVCSRVTASPQSKWPRNPADTDAKSY